MNAAGEVAVLHRDAHFLVLNKPSGLATTSPSATPTLVEAARELDPRAPRLHPSSRLDAEVSGVVIFARTREATEHLLRARAAGRYERTYLALSVRAPENAAGRWDAAIAIDARDPRKRAAVEAGVRGAREASTRYRTLREGAGFALLALAPETGRTHQLRVHAAHAGLPLLGDRHYGGATRVVLADGRVLAVRRTMLHCARVRVPDPSGRAALCFEAEPPADFGALFRALAGQALTCELWQAEPG